MANCSCFRFASLLSRLGRRVPPWFKAARKGAIHGMANIGGTSGSFGSLGIWNHQNDTMSGGWVFHQFGTFQWALTFIQRKGFILTCSKVHRWCFDLCCQSTAMAGRETQHVRVKKQSLTLCRGLTAISSIHDSRRWSDVAAKMIYLCASNVARKRGAGWSSSWSTARTTVTAKRTIRMWQHVKG